jgi:hypothetical protein
MSAIDMTLDEHTEVASDFTSDSPMPNIWAIDEDHKDDDKHDEDEDKIDLHSEPQVITSSMEEELERPSFLRRLTKRRHQDEPEEAVKDDKKDAADSDKEDSKKSKK